MSQKVELRPGWMILDDAVTVARDAKMEIETPEDAAAMIAAQEDMMLQLQARMTEIIPESENARILAMIGEVAARHLRAWPHEVFDFVVNHGGMPAVQAFLDANPEWETLEQPCGCGETHIHVLRTTERVRREESANQLAVQLGDLFGLLGARGVRVVRTGEGFRD